MTSVFRLFSVIRFKYCASIFIFGKSFTHARNIFQGQLESNLNSTEFNNVQLAFNETLLCLYCGLHNLYLIHVLHKFPIQEPDIGAL